jgi:hypothetical protein
LYFINFNSKYFNSFYFATSFKVTDLSTISVVNEHIHHNNFMYFFENSDFIGPGFQF